MELYVRDIARILRVPERTVDRWVRQEKLPAELVAGQYRFNRAEVFEWAMSRRMDIPHEIVNDGAAELDETVTLTSALKNGGELRDVAGTEKESVLRAVVERMSLPDAVDRELLWQLLVQREGAGSTGIGGGIALPHPRHPVVLPVRVPSITLCFPQQPIDFGARDGVAVHTLFVLVSRSVRSHLTLLAQVATALNDHRFRELVVGKARFETILTEARRFQPKFHAESAELGVRNRSPVTTK
ncbi:MAG TPA: PTS sugar transporter subunit IIA [Pirellulales bacterium]|nr:PTS sugar transporter subunit IIA [Pirellulales bacterium]